MLSPSPAKRSRAKSQAGGRAERRERSRRRILDAARAALTEGDDSRVTVREIAARAKVSPGLVMQHFETMADLVLEVFVEANADLDAQLKAAAEEETSVRGRIFSAFRRLAERDLARPLLSARLMAGAWTWSAEREARFQESVTTLTRRLMTMLDDPAGSAPQASAPQASAPQAAAPQASAPQASAPQAAAPQAAREAAATALIAVYNVNLRRAVAAGLDPETAIARMTPGFDLVLAGLDAMKKAAARG